MIFFSYVKSQKQPSSQQFQDTFLTKLIWYIVYQYYLPIPHERQDEVNKLPIFCIQPIHLNIKIETVLALFSWSITEQKIVSLPCWIRLCHRWCGVLMSSFQENVFYGRTYTQKQLKIKRHVSQYQFLIFKQGYNELVNHKYVFMFYFFH